MCFSQFNSTDFRRSVFLAGHFRSIGSPTSVTFLDKFLHYLQLFLALSCQNSCQISASSDIWHKHTHVLVVANCWVLTIWPKWLTPLRCTAPSLALAGRDPTNSPPMCTSDHWLPFHWILKLCKCVVKNERIRSKTGVLATTIWPKSPSEFPSILTESPLSPNSPATRGMKFSWMWTHPTLPSLCEAPPLEKKKLDKLT